MKITIIGNKKAPDNSPLADGGRLKTSLYFNKLIAEGFQVEFIELSNWRKRVFRLLIQIKQGISNSQVVIIMGGPNGCRPLIKICNFFNTKRKTRIIFIMLGIGTIDKKIKRLNEVQVNQFLKNGDTFKVKDRNMAKALSKLDLVVTQNEILANFYEKFYELTNVRVLNNFRDFKKRPAPRISNNINGGVKFVYFSRVNEEKGIFDLLEAVETLKTRTKSEFSLDIYGQLQLNSTQILKYESLLTENVKYLGILENDLVLNVLNQYDFMIFPTKYHGEGTPGSIIESFLAGLPVLTSSYSQAHLLVTHGQNGFIFQQNDVESLVREMLKILDLDNQYMNNLKQNAYTTGSTYSYETNREMFLSYVTGGGK